jgi:Domain of unknown function (DUF5666)
VCTELKNGDTVYAIGPKQSDNTVLASKIYYVAPPAPAPAPAPTPTPDVTLNGAIASLGGTCPALSMSVAGTLVKTGAATVFNVKACADLKNGDTIYAIGPRQSDNSVLASKIYYVAPTPPPVTVTGAIAGVGGSCPALSLTVNGMAVKTNSATAFSGKACSQIKSGDAGQAIGPKQADGTVLAEKLYVSPSSVR